MSVPATEAVAAAIAAPDNDLQSFMADVAKEKAEPAKADDAKLAAEDEATATDADGDPLPKPDEPEAKAEEPEPEAEPEPEVEKPTTLSKQLDAIHRAKTRASRELDKREAALTQREQEVAKFRASAEPEVAAFRDARRRVYTDPGAVLMALGVPEEHLEQVAQAIYMSSKSAPKELKAQAAQLQQMRQQESQARSLQERLDRMEQERNEERQQQQTSRVVEQFHADARTTATNKSPMVANLLKSEPAETLAELEKMAFAIHARGDVPTAESCVIEYEKRLRTRLKALGVDANKIKNPNGRENTTARSLSNGMSTQTKPRPASSSPEEELESFIADTRAGKGAPSEG